MMVAIRSSSDQTKHWYMEKRNILQDLENLYGEPIRYIDAIALMTRYRQRQGQGNRLLRRHIFFGKLNYACNLTFIRRQRFSEYF